MLETAGGILIAAAVIGAVVGIFRNPESAWEIVKAVGALGCLAFLIGAIWLQLR